MKRSDSWDGTVTEGSRYLRNYQDLRVWQQSISLVKVVYQHTGRFPATERFGLVAQMRRAAVSIPSNIAEGHSRSGSRDFLRFLSIALGSVAELETQSIISSELGFLQSPLRDEILAQLNSIGKMLRGLQKSIEPYCVKDIEMAYGTSTAPWNENPFDSEQSSLEPPVSSPGD